MNKQGFHQQGFTLLEILMVVTLMAVLSGIFLSLSFKGEKALENEARLFVNQLESAQRNAVGLNAIMALNISAQSFQFFRLDLAQNAFLELEEFNKTELDLSMSLVLNTSGDDIEWNYTPAYSAYQSFFEDASEGEIILVLPGGDIKPAFEIEFRDSDNSVKIAVDKIGNIDAPFLPTDDSNEKGGA